MANPASATDLITAAPSPLNGRLLVVAQKDNTVPVYVRLFHPGVLDSAGNQVIAGSQGLSQMGPLGLRLDALRKGRQSLTIDLDNDLRYVLQVRGDNTAWFNYDGAAASVGAYKVSGAPGVTAVY